MRVAARISVAGAPPDRLGERGGAAVRLEKFPDVGEHLRGSESRE
jgi:hypothetical protein